MLPDSSGATRTAERRPLASAPLWIAAAGAAVRLVLAAHVPLTTDEAYYVDWTRHLSPGYLDHPPAVAWLLAGALHLLGASTLAARVPAIALQLATTLLAADLARARAGDRAAAAAAAILQAAPVFSLGATLITPDAPLAFGWAGTLWAVDRAFRRDPRWFLAAGGFLGVAVLSKLTAGLLGLGVLAALVATPDGRRALARPWPWAGALLALAIAAPFLAWNASRGWPSVAFQADHGLGTRFSLARLAGSVVAQAGYVSPLLLALAAAAGARALRAVRDPAGAALAFTALPVVAFFTAAAALKPALPHWPAPGWLSGCVLLAIAGTRWLRPAVGVGLASSVAVVVAIPLLPARALDELRGWRGGASAARAAAGDARLAAGHWMILGHLGWYDGRSPAYVGERRSGPTFYDPAPLERGEPVLVVTVDGLGPQRDALQARLGPLEPAGDHLAREAGREVRRFRFWRWRPPP